MHIGAGLHYGCLTLSCMNGNRSRSGTASIILRCTRITLASYSVACERLRRGRLLDQRSATRLPENHESTIAASYGVNSFLPTEPQSRSGCFSAGRSPIRVSHLMSLSFVFDRSPIARWFLDIACCGAVSAGAVVPLQRTVPYSSTRKPIGLLVPAESQTSVPHVDFQNIGSFDKTSGCRKRAKTLKTQSRPF